MAHSGCSFEMRQQGQLVCSCVSSSTLALSFVEDNKTLAGWSDIFDLNAGIQLLSISLQLFVWSNTEV